MSNGQTYQKRDGELQHYAVCERTARTKHGLDDAPLGLARMFTPSASEGRGAGFLSRDEDRAEPRRILLRFELSLWARWRLLCSKSLELRAVENIDGKRFTLSEIEAHFPFE
jgi:hypothetical protein